MRGLDVLQYKDKAARVRVDSPVLKEVGVSLGGRVLGISRGYLAINIAVHSGVDNLPTREECTPRAGFCRGKLSYGLRGRGLGGLWGLAAEACEVRPRQNVSPPC